MKISMFNSTLFTLLLILQICYCNNTFLKKSNDDIKSKGCTNNNPLNSPATNKTKISTLILTSEGNKPAIINFKIKNSALLWSLGLLDNKLTIRNANQLKNFELDSNKSVLFRGSTLSLNSLDLKSSIKFNNTNQWKLFVHDNFYKNETSLDWNHDKTTRCNYYYIMGGHCQISTKELIKEIKNLPIHSQIKIEATYHFIGNWDSNTGYLKLDHINGNQNEPKYVWSQRCQNSKTRPLVNLCPYEVCKIASPINVTINHTDSIIRLIFGSTLERGSCEQSYGIGDVKIYIK